MRVLAFTTAILAILCAPAAMAAAGVAQPVTATPVAGHHHHAKHHHAHHHLSQLAATQVSTPTPAPHFTSALAQANQGPSATPSLYQEGSRAGWGWKEGNRETLVGVYQRPTDPSQPNSDKDMIQEGSGAAGVSVAIKLGK